MTEEFHEMTYVVKVTSYGSNDHKHQLEIGGHVCRQMHLAFGNDRVQVWHEGKRLIFDPAAAAGSRPIYESVVEAPTEAHIENGKEP